MADIKLTRPAAGQNVVVPSAPDARMVLDFAADQVSIDRPQGSDSLYFRFDDGSSIELQNFYTQYNKDAIPSFEVDGQLIAGADFFNAFGPDLAPAAGPAAGPTRSGRYSDFGNSNLADGVNHLDGLDYRLSFAGDTQPNLDPYPLITNSAPRNNGPDEARRDITQPGQPTELSIPFTGLQDTSYGVLQFAQEEMDRMTRSGLNPMLRKAYVDKIDATVTATAGGWLDRLKQAEKEQAA